MTTEYNGREHVVVNDALYDPGEWVRATCFIWNGLAWERASMRFALFLFTGLLALTTACYFDAPFNLATQIKVGIAMIVLVGAGASMVQLAYRGGQWRMETAIKRGHATLLE